MDVQLYHRHVLIWLSRLYGLYTYQGLILSCTLAAIKAMTGVVWASDPSDLGEGLKAKPCMKLSYWWNSWGNLWHFSKTHLFKVLSQILSCPVRTVWGPDCDYRVGNLQHVKQLQHYVATRLPTRYFRMGYSSNLLDKALWSLYIEI